MNLLKPALALALISLLCSTALCQPITTWFQSAEPVNDQSSGLAKQLQFGQSVAATAMATDDPDHGGKASKLWFGRADGTITAVDLKTDQTIVQHNLGSATPIDFSPQGDVVVSLSDDKKRIGTDKGPIVKLWDTASGQEKFTINPQSAHTSVSTVQDVDFTPDGSILALAVGEFYFGGVELWDAATGKFLRYLETPPGEGARQNAITGMTGGVDAVSFSPDGKYIAATSLASSVGKKDDKYEGKIIGIWETATGKWQRTIKLRRSYSSAALLWTNAMDAGLLDTDGQVINNWQPKSGEWAATVIGTGTSAQPRRFSIGSNDSPLLLVRGRGAAYIAVGKGNTLNVYSGGLGLVSTITSPITITSAMAVDDNIIACGLADGTVRLWNIWTSQPG